MAATQLVVIYATASGILRRKIIPDDDSQLASHQPGPGESRLLLPLAQPYHDAACRAAITAATGVTPPSGRCCIVDGSGNVVGTTQADPALDTHPLGTLVAHDRAGPGDVRQGGVFRRQFAVVNQVTNRVVAIVLLPIDSPVAGAGNYLSPPGGLKAGDTVPVRSVTAGV